MMRHLKRLYIGIVFFFLYAPILILMIFSFNKSRYMSKWDGFSLKWYADLFSDRDIMSALYYTILIAVLSLSSLRHRPYNCDRYTRYE